MGRSHRKVALGISLNLQAVERQQDYRASKKAGEGKRLERPFGGANTGQPNQKLANVSACSPHRLGHFRDSFQLEMHADTIKTRLAP